MASSRSPAIAFLPRTCRLNDCHHVRPALKLNVYRELVASVQVGSPISRNFSCRARCRLVLWVPTWRSELGPHFHHFLCLIIPQPHLPRLEAGRDGMAGSLKVLGSMLAGRAVTTADMPALSTTPQVQPPPIRGETLNTPVATWSRRRIDPRVCFHEESPRVPPDLVADLSGA